ncbi:MAG: DMT family transporter [Proteobacteria bacterium]|nr:DMT family transporter [Pseudomonadota bacterium]
MTGGRLAGVLIGFAGVAVMIGPAALAGQEPYPAIWNRSDVAISACGQERLEERSSATVEGHDAATGRKRRVPSGCPPAASRCVIPLARCASIAPRGMPDGLAAGGQQSGSKWPDKAPGANLVAQIACLGAALSYGFAVSFGRRFARLGVSPVQTAAGQVTASALILLPLSMMVDRPWTLPAPGMEAVAAIVALALLSTAVAYILFFRLLASAGATNIALVTLLVPVSAILLGTLILGERLEPEHFAGMALIGLGLAAIDGRPARALGQLVTARSG